MLELKTSIEIDTDDIKVPDQWHNLLHRLWSKAVGTPDYVKDDWIELEQILHHVAKMEIR